MEAWAKELARQMLEPREGDAAESVLLRVAIALVQARAKEARHVSGVMMMAATNPRNPDFMAHKMLAMQFGDRAQMLEEFALKMAGMPEEAAIELPAGATIQ